MADARIALWECWYGWPLVCLGTSECDCEQHQADDDEALAIYQREQWKEDELWRRYRNRPRLW